MNKVLVTDRALLATLPPLPAGYGPKIYWGPQDAGAHVWFNQHHGDWIESGRGDSHEHAYFHAYKREPVKRVRWANMYPIPRTSFESRAAADRAALSDRIACVRIEFEEGQYDD